MLEILKRPLVQLSLVSAFACSGCASLQAVKPATEFLPEMDQDFVCLLAVKTNNALLLDWNKRARADFPAEFKQIMMDVETHYADRFAAKYDDRASAEMMLAAYDRIKKQNSDDALDALKAKAAQCRDDYALQR